MQDDYSDTPSPSPQTTEAAHLLSSSSMSPDNTGNSSGLTNGHHHTNLNQPSRPTSPLSPSILSTHSSLNGTSWPSTRVISTGSTSFVSSPLNPTPSSSGGPPQVTNPFACSRYRSGSRASPLVDTLHAYSHGNAHHRNGNGLETVSSGTGIGTPGPSRGGPMLLYRLASDEDVLFLRSSSPRDSNSRPLQKVPKGANIPSSISSCISRDSRYPSHSSLPIRAGGLVPYEYDPAPDLSDPPDEEDFLHDPSVEGPRPSGIPWRGVLNVTVLGGLLMALLVLFVCYPILTFYSNEGRMSLIDGNIHINGSGQAPVLFQMPSLIDSTTPSSALTRTGYDGHPYDLVFSDEFSVDGRTFYPGDDPYWEAVNLWYGVTADLEWYDPSQVTTRDGALVITMDSVATQSPGLTPGSTAPFTREQNHNMEYRSGMLQSWNKFCFTSGYIEVSVVLPGPNEDATGYWPGAWTMGNLARPGYPASTDGMWPYTYDSCDVGTFPNQTNKDRLGPAAALHSDQSRAEYNYELSWLSGQRLSACSCPDSDHPGPVHNNVYKGRGAPEIDIIEAEKDKETGIGHIVSQSAQFAPMTHDYLFENSSEDSWVVYTPDVTRTNGYRGNAVQQAVSGLVRLRPDMFQGSGKRFTTFGFETWANPKNVQEGYITWQVDGRQSHRLGATAVVPDQGPGGSGVGQRLIPEEPMSIIFNLGMSQSWQKVELPTLIFPAEFLIDYVRVYQRRGSRNFGCNPKDYPTRDYINAHRDAYENANTTTWNWMKPRNSLYDGC